MHSCFEHLGERGGGNPKNIDISFGWAENHKVTQLKDVIEPHSLINSLRSKGVECVKTAVMLYNGAQHSTPNMLFFGREEVLPTGLFQEAPL